MDVSNAYDMVEWISLKEVMMIMGFKLNMVEQIMSYVTIASFSILVNGIPKGHIVPSRGSSKGTLYPPTIFYFAQD